MIYKRLDILEIVMINTKLTYEGYTIHKIGLRLASSSKNRRNSTVSVNVKRFVHDVSPTMSIYGFILVRLFLVLNFLRFH